VQGQIEKDLKTALLSGDKIKVETLKGLKSSFQYEAVAKSVKLDQLTDEQMQAVMSRESKKRQEAAELYKNAGETERAEKELSEKAIIDKYLPEPVDEAAVREAVAQQIAKIDNASMQNMGQIIAAVRAQLGPGADGGRIAAAVKESLQ